jgi:hypothetical protein
MIRRIALVAALSLALGACASGGSGGAEGAEGSDAASTAKEHAPPPAGSELAKVENGMTDIQVRKIMGDPDNQTTYMTGKQFIPWYFGPTHQTDWIYYGKGRVVFAINRWSGSLAVIRTAYNPKEGK